ncbi:MAG: MarR family transcriptional regulator [Balneolaceae bacterium]
MSDQTTSTAPTITEQQRLRNNLFLTSGWIRNEIKSFLDQFEITQQQFNTLRILKENEGDPLSTNDLCEQMIDKMSDTSRIVERLVGKKLVTKKPCPHDGRKVQVFITKDGLYLLSTITTKINKLDEVFNSVSFDEMKQLNHLLEKLRS